PRTLEGYYQEAGRAGRDERPSDCLVLWTHADLERGVVAPEVRRYLESHGCRRRILLAHFGQTGVVCSRCDRRKSGREAGTREGGRVRPRPTSPFPRLSPVFPPDPAGFPYPPLRLLLPGSGCLMAAP